MLKNDSVFKYYTPWGFFFINEFRAKNLSYYFLNPVIPDQTPMAPSVHAFLKPAQCGLEINIRKTTCAFLIYTAVFGLLAGCCVCLFRFNLWGSLSPWKSRYLLLFFGKLHSSLCVWQGDEVTFASISAVCCNIPLKESASAVTPRRAQSCCN